MIDSISRQLEKAGIGPDLEAVHQLLDAGADAIATDRPLKCSTSMRLEENWNETGTVRIVWQEL